MWRLRSRNSSMTVVGVARFARKIVRWRLPDVSKALSRSSVIVVPLRGRYSTNAVPYGPPLKVHVEFVGPEECEALAVVDSEAI
jgi:hypothetical protein